MITSGRPVACARCGAVEMHQWLAERLDEDGEVIVGAVECAWCGALRLYRIKAPRRREAR